jgi:hypothetical protein
MASRTRRSYETASSILGAMKSQWTRERMAEPPSEGVRPDMLHRSSHVIAERATWGFHSPSMDEALPSDDSTGHAGQARELTRSSSLRACHLDAFRLRVSFTQKGG